MSDKQITANSTVVATLNTPAGNGVWLQLARVQNGKLVVRLNRPAKAPAKFTFFVLDEVV